MAVKGRAPNISKVYDFLNRDSLVVFLPIVSLALWLIGCGLICYGAYWNGKHKGNFHPVHHLIRMGIALVITILLALI